MPAPPPLPGPDRSPWPHAPLHWLSGPGTYLLTAATYRHERIFRSDAELSGLRDRVLKAFLDNGWALFSWAFLINHYHVLGRDGRAGIPDGERLRFLARCHYEVARWINAAQATPGRRVWYNVWDTRITHQTSFLARMRYVNENPVRHRLVTTARDYPWCSAAWFESHAPLPFVASVARFGIDRVVVPGEVDES